jgi:hypothetical protein
MVAKIATGEVEEQYPTSRQVAGRAGGEARAEIVNADERAEQARRAALARWARSTSNS